MRTGNHYRCGRAAEASDEADGAPALASKRRRSLLPEPCGFEGFGLGEKHLPATDPPVLNAEDAPELDRYLRAAHLSATALIKAGDDVRACVDQPAKLDLPVVPVAGPIRYRLNQSVVAYETASVGQGRRLGDQDTLGDKLEHRRKITRLKSFVYSPNDFDVLLRHRPPSIAVPWAGRSDSRTPLSPESSDAAFASKR
jgi:hypothetical protein